jgi:hypothetical protein
MTGIPIAVSTFGGTVVVVVVVVVVRCFLIGSTTLPVFVPLHHDGHKPHGPPI